MESSILYGGCFLIRPTIWSVLYHWLHTDVESSWCKEFWQLLTWICFHWFNLLQHPAADVKGVRRGLIVCNLSLPPTRFTSLSLRRFSIWNRRVCMLNGGSFISSTCGWFDWKGRSARSAVHPATRSKKKKKNRKDRRTGGLHQKLNVLEYRNVALPPWKWIRPPSLFPSLRPQFRL